MTKKLELYRCDICGNLVEVVLEGEGVLVCCGEEMELLSPKTEDNMAEKHVPIIERQEGGATIKVGKVPHPMESEHYIQFIEAISSDNKYLKRKYLSEGEEAVLNLKCDCNDKISARENCNIHGLFGAFEGGNYGQ